MSDDATTPDETETAPADEAGGPTVDELQSKLSEARDQMLRALADADNVRKRSEREISDARAYAVTNFARDLLSVADNLARALAALPEEARDSMGETGKNLLAGVEITERELHSALSRNGVTPIPAEPGAAFDPNLHQAAVQAPSEYPSGAIVQVIQPGWSIGDRVLRAAMVAVSSGPAKPAPAADGGPATSVDGADEGSDAGPAPGSNVDTKI